MSRQTILHECFQVTISKSYFTLLDKANGWFSVGEKYQNHSVFHHSSRAQWPTNQCQTHLAWNLQKWSNIWFLVYLSVNPSIMYFPITSTHSFINCYSPAPRHFGHFSKFSCKNELNLIVISRIPIKFLLFE